MKKSIPGWYICPECRSRLKAVSPRRLVCAKGHAHPVVKGVPYLLPRRGRYAVKQVTENFSYQWKIWKSFPKAYLKFRKNWFLAKLGVSTEAGFAKLIRGRKRILDAGTGLGYKLELMAAASRGTEIIGADLSGSVHEAERNTRRFPNVHVVRGNIFQLPFPRGSFDLIISDGVIHHTPDARGACLALAKLLAPGGILAIHVYKKMGPVRELTDDLVQRACRVLPPRQGLEFVKAYTELGRALDGLGAQIVIKRPLPTLGIPAGKTSVQRLVYYSWFQCHWNPRLNFEQNNLVNFDWYHPWHATRHTPSEVRGWYKRAGLRDVRIPITNVKGVTALGRRP